MHNSRRKSRGIIVLMPDYSRVETIETMDSILFTNLVIKHIRKVPLGHFTDKIRIVAEQNKLDLKVCGHGIRYRNDSLHKALTIIEQSAKYN